MTSCLAWPFSRGIIIYFRTSEGLYYLIKLFCLSTEGLQCNLKYRIRAKTELPEGPSIRQDFICQVSEASRSFSFLAWGCHVPVDALAFRLFYPTHQRRQNFFYFLSPIFVKFDYVINSKNISTFYFAEKFEIFFPANKWL